MTVARHAVVTGAGQGIGEGIARRLGADGWHVWCVDLGANAQGVAAAIVEAGGAAVAVGCDLADPSQIARAWARIDAGGGVVTALVNNAGIFPRTPATDIPLEEWNHVLAVNLTGGFLMAQEFARRAIPSGGGAMVSLASGQAYRPRPLGAHYAASKAAIVNLNRVLAGEWSPQGVRVNSIVPGVVDTAQPRAVMGDEEFEAIAASNPIRRLVTPADLGAAVAFLLSDDAQAITGQVIAVNGGNMML